MVNHIHVVSDAERLEPGVLSCVRDERRKLNGTIDDFELAQQTEEDYRNAGSASSAGEEGRLNAPDDFPLPVGPLMTVNMPSGKTTST